MSVRFMSTRFAWPLVVGVFTSSVAACDKDAPPSAAPAATPSATPVEAVEARPACGLRLGDWCPSAPNDACGKHKSVEECRADTTCKGMPYKGESLVACKYDDAGFATNCPTVGCISR